ncbi:hypothetical protein F4780DRAFT_783581 [Xylariomycetidae sp. FL0641]|nr:hypothetical protein F4780DRAFT_783581 [Xylariomycetidae sp. FL0641]
MKTRVGVLVASFLAIPAWGAPVKRNDIATNWYTDSASGVAESLERKREEDTDWYTDSAAGVADSLDRKREESTDWYTDSAAGVAETLARKRDESTDWYTDSAAGVADSLERKRDEGIDWYTDSAAGMAGSLEGKRDESTDWYTDSAAGVANSLVDEKRDENSDWYTDSASGMSESLSVSARDQDNTDWYTDSAAGVAESLDSAKRATDGGSTDWYTDSASGVAESLTKRAMTNAEKEGYEKSLRDWIYEDMRTKPLRASSERGKAFFEFTPKPRVDVVDRWHVPAELQERFRSVATDAERVSMLNYYLMVTGREPRPASALGFQPTFDRPGLTETNEVGYGYALAGQHQAHCTDFVADAVDIGKDNLNDFFLKHTIHCLGLLKYLAPQLTMKQPTSFLLSEANDRVANGYPQTIQ